MLSELHKLVDLTKEKMLWLQIMKIYFFTVCEELNWNGLNLTINIVKSNKEDRVEQSILLKVLMSQTDLSELNRINLIWNSPTKKHTHTHKAASTHPLI